MTYAPDDLLAVRKYLKPKTNLDDNSLGIAGDTAHATTGGYHEGNDDLAAANRLNTDYSKRESPRDRPGTNAASAFDIGNFDHNGRNLRQLTQFIVAACKRNDSRCRDIREVIYTPNGVTVERWDALGIRTTGDSSHLYHTHTSFFRDSEGRRANPDNFMGLLTEFFEGKTQMTDVTAINVTDPDFEALIWRVVTLIAGTDTVQGGPTTGEKSWIVQTVKRIETKLDTVNSKLDTLLAKPGMDQAAIEAAVAEAFNESTVTLADDIVTRLAGRLANG